MGVLLAVSAAADTNGRGVEEPLRTGARTQTSNPFKQPGSQKKFVRNNVTRLEQFRRTAEIAEQKERAAGGAYGAFETD